MKFKKGDYIVHKKDSRSIRRILEIINDEDGGDAYKVTDPTKSSTARWNASTARWNASTARWNASTARWNMVMDCDFTHKAYRLIGSSKQDYKLYLLQRELNGGI